MNLAAYFVIAVQQRKQRKQRRAAETRSALPPLCRQVLATLAEGAAGPTARNIKLSAPFFTWPTATGWLGAAEASLSWSVIHGRVECLIVLVVDGVLLPIHDTSGAGFKPISRLRGCRPSDHNKGRQGVKKQQGARRGGFWLVIICKIK